MWFPLILLAALVAFVGRPVVQDDLFCRGCTAEKHNDPVTGMANGVQVTTAPGYTVTGAVLGTKNGTCFPDECWPNLNCEFWGVATFHGPGPFHENGLVHDPCKLSVPSGTEHVLTLRVDWIASCDNTITWRELSVFDGHNCLLGSLGARVQFGGKCTACAFVPLPPAGD